MFCVKIKESVRKNIQKMGDYKWRLYLKTWNYG